jgi:hypothetical protein
MKTAEELRLEITELVQEFADLKYMEKTLSASTLCVSKSTSTNTGIAPNCTIGLTVVGKPAATPMTSSPLYNLWLIEDCCDALGAKYNNQHVGTFGDIATCSFYPAHHNDASTIYCNSVAPITFPDGGTTLLPGLKVCISGA